MASPARPATTPAALDRPVSGATAVRAAPPDELALLQLVMGTPDMESHLHQVTVMTADLSGAIGGVGLTLRRDGHVLSVAVSSSLAATVDEVQYAMDTGPCLETLRTGKVVSAPDFADETRWGAYPAHALSRGVLSSLSVPVGVAGHIVGVLNAYGTQRQVFTGDLADRIVTLAAYAGTALALALRDARQIVVVDGLRTAIEFSPSSTRL